MMSLIAAGLLLAMSGPETPPAGATGSAPATPPAAASADPKRSANLTSTASMPYAPPLSDKGKGVKAGDTVCKVYPVTGTRFTKKYCRTAADWALITEESKAQIEKWQRTDPTVPGS